MDLEALGEQLDLFEREVRCPVCLDSFKEPFAFPCNHLFCKECLLQAIKVCHACPVCKIPYFKRDMRKIPVLEGVTEIYQRIRALYEKVVPPKPIPPMKPFKPFSPKRSPARLSERRANTVLELTDQGTPAKITRRSSSRDETAASTQSPAPAAPAPASRRKQPTAPEISTAANKRLIVLDKEEEPAPAAEAPPPAKRTRASARQQEALTSPSKKPEERVVATRKSTEFPPTVAPSQPAAALESDDSLLAFDIFAPTSKKNSSSALRKNASATKSNPPDENATLPLSSSNSRKSGTVAAKDEPPLRSRLPQMNEAAERGTSYLRMLSSSNSHPANHGTVRNERAAANGGQAATESPELEPMMTLRLTLSDDEQADGPSSKGKAPSATRSARVATKSKSATVRQLRVKRVKRAAPEEGQKEESESILYWTEEEDHGEKESAENKEEEDVEESKDSEDADDAEESENEESVNEDESESPRNRKSQLVFLPTSLTDERKKTLKKVAAKCGARIVNSWKPGVTHVVTESQRQTPRTLKLVFGILGGVWIVCGDWLDACFKAGKLVDESKFEVKSDTVAADGPRKGRLRVARKEPGLFHGLKFHFAGRFEHPSPEKSDLIKCVEIGGGEVLRSQPRPVNDSSLRIICDDEELSSQLAGKFEGKVVRSGWLLDCVSSYSLIREAKYVATS